MRDFLVAGNWKMNGSTAANGELISGILSGMPSASRIKLLICPPFPYLEAARRQVEGTRLAVGAQNVSAHAKGAYTGEVSAAMLRDIGCEYVIVGHSERRALMHESSADVAAKFEAALAHRLTHPSFRVPRTYHVVLNGELDPKVIEKLSRGVWLAEGRTGPVQVRVKKRERDVTVVEVVVREGMNREVRRVFAKFGLKVKHLKRVRIGRLELGNLGDGKYRTLTRHDLDLLLADAAAPKGRPPKEEGDDRGSEEE